MRQIASEDRKLLEQHFPSVRHGPKDRNKPELFEIALVLAGGASGGAYTAGVLDYLIEALDEWHLKKAEDRAAGRALTPHQHVPHHDVVLRIITGTSAGGRSGVVIAAVLNHKFPHVYAKAKFDVLYPGQAQNYSKNMFFESWVIRADMERLLDIADLKDKKKGLMSLLNDSDQDKLADDVVSDAGDRVPPGMRDWVAKPLQIRLTNMNLRGVPFAFNLRAESPAAHEAFESHADQLAFALEVASSAAPESSPPDCIPLTEEEPRANANWQKLKMAGLATGAFPIVFRARDVERGPTDYRWRDSYFDVDLKTCLFVNPAWPGGKPPKTYTYAAVDGGVLNNEPFEIARKALCGVRGRNEQSGALADRAVILIDPLVEDSDLAPLHHPDILDVSKRLIPAQIAQARLSSQDLLQVLSPDVYSRFMVSPTRKGQDETKYFGTKALASGALGAWFGLFARPLREHDYFLGRRNAQKFLTTVFTLPAGNTLFAHNRWSAGNGEEFADKESPRGELHLQIIPVCGTAREVEPVPDWPRDAYAPRKKQIAALIRQRVFVLGGSIPGRARRAILEQAKGAKFRAKVAAFFAGLFASVWLWVGWHAIRGSLTRKIIDAVDKAAAETNQLA